MGKRIGKGTFGEVFICTQYDTNDQRAVKMIAKDRMDHADNARLINEINILRNLDHPNIVKIFEYFEDS